MRDLLDDHDPEAELIQVVLDDLSTHSAAAVYENFAPEETRRILRRLEFHYTLKHASWLNMVRIEIGVMVGQCIDRRIPDEALLRRRNTEKALTHWLFTVDRARENAGSALPFAALIHR